MKSMVGIYKITNQINGKVYIGQSTDINRRWREHKNSSNKAECLHYPLYRAFAKYGLQNFVFEVIEECKVDELNQKEIFWINKYDSYRNGYNQTNGGQNASHFNSLNQEKLDLITYELKYTTTLGIDIAKKYNVSDQTISDINCGRIWKRDSETYPLRKNVKQDNFCAKCGVLILPSSVFCVKCAGENLRIIERPSKEILWEKIYKTSFSAVAREYGVSDNAIRKWCDSYNLPRHSKELKKLYETEVLKITHSKEEKQTKKGYSKIVLQCDKNDPSIVIAEYPSSHEAGRALGNEQKYKHIGEVCRGSRKSAYGYSWRYKDN